MGEKENVSSGLRRDNRIFAGEDIGRGREGSVESMLSKTAKERVHMYAGDVGT